VVDFNLSVKETRRVVNLVKAGRLFVDWTRQVPIDSIFIAEPQPKLKKELINFYEKEGQRQHIGVFCDR
jgi:hypothetical protein